MAKTLNTPKNGTDTHGISAKQFSLLAKHLNLYPTGMPRIFDTEKTRHNVSISRKQASTWLENNFEGQRGVSPTRVKVLSNKMKEGVWMATPQGIVVDWYGRLIDGQHRLFAFLDSGLAEIHMTVTTGSDPKYFLHLDEDVGARQLKDLLTSGGMGHGALTSSAFRMMLSYDTNQQRELGDKGFISMGHVSLGKWKSNREETVAWCLTHRALLGHIADRLNTKDAKAILRPMSVFSGFYLWVSLDDAARADQFFEDLITGAELKVDSPVYQLRKELLKIQSKVAESRVHTQSFMHCALLIKAWNAYLLNSSIKVLRFTVSEDWPKRIGAKRVFKMAQATVD
jgi:hypothetical protein